MTLNELDDAKLQAFGDDAITWVATASTPQDLQTIRVALTGKKSHLTTWSKQLGTLDADAKKTVGGWLHALRTRIQTALDDAQKQLAAQALAAKLASEAIDITSPARGQSVGNLHPITQTAERMQAFFLQAGFEVATGPEVESDYYNFEAVSYTHLRAHET